MGTRFMFILSVVFYLGLTAHVPAKETAELKSIHIISDIKYRFATTRVSMTYYNPDSFAVTADLHVNIPKNAFISNFSMEMDGKVTVGEVKKRLDAENIFQDAIKRGSGAGYVEVKHRYTDIFDISVNVEPEKYIVYNLTYQELLTRKSHQYNHEIHLSHGGIVDKFLVEVFINEPQDIINLVVPKITNGTLTNTTDDGGLDSASIKNITSKNVYIKYNPSRKQQQEISKDGVAGLLTVKYDLKRTDNSNFIYALDGYFVHFFSIDSVPSLKKDIVFMLDISKSMSGTKMKQLKEAMIMIIDQLDPELDEFLIGVFSRKVSWIKNIFLKANEVNKQLAKNYIGKLAVKGGTNINSALLQSIEKHKNVLSTTKKKIIIFLTDGQPTLGESNVDIIKTNIKSVNNDISLFTLGFGEDCDSKFLHEITSENGGFNRKIYVDSDSKFQIKNLYEEIANILLKDISIIYLDGTFDTSSTSFSNYFKGSELVVAGVLSDKSLQSILLSLPKTDRMGKHMELFEVTINGGQIRMWGKEHNDTVIESFYEIPKKTYVYLTLQELLKKNRTQDVRNKIVNLALKYNFVTPLTSMVVEKAYVKEEHFEEAEYLTTVYEVRSLGPPLLPFKLLEMPGIHALHHGAMSRFPNNKPRGTGISLNETTTNIIPTVEKIPARGTGISLNETTTNIIPTVEKIPARGTGISLNETTTNIIPTVEKIPARGTGISLNETTTNIIPTVEKIPAIIIKPVSCQSSLCFTHYNHCRKQTKIKLLTDKLAKIYIFGYVKNISDSNCLETLDKVLIKVNRIYLRFTPDYTIIKGKRYDVSKMKVITYKLNKFVRVSINFQKTVNSGKFISMHFQQLRKFIRPKGILSDYFTSFNCIENPPNELRLSHKTSVFHKVNYMTDTGALDQCFKM